jgi:hypothetical protein
MPKELRDIDDIPLGNHYLKLDVSTLSETIGNFLTLGYRRGSNVM